MSRKTTSKRFAVRAALLALMFAGIVPFAAAFQQKKATPPAKPQGMTVDGVIRLVQGGIAEEVIIERLRQANKPMELSDDDLLNLKKNNVSDNIQRVMINPSAQVVEPKEPPPIPPLAPLAPDPKPIEAPASIDTPAKDVPPPVAGGGAGSGAVAAAACGDYDACLQAAKKAYLAKDWPGATAAFQAAADQRPGSGEPWVWLGRILFRDGQPHQPQDLSNAWDKALSLGANLVIGACHVQAFRCEIGDLSLSAKSISFIASGSRTVFSATPGEIDPGRIARNPAGPHISYSLKVAGKNYSLVLLPLEAPCTINLTTVQCPQEGMNEQIVLAQYVSQALKNSRAVH